MEVLRIDEHRPVEVIERPDDLPPVWVPLRIHRLIDDEARVTVGPVVDPLALLILHDLLLLGHDVIGHRVDEEPELVGLRPQRLLQGVVRHHLEVVRSIAARRSVGRTAHARHETVEATGPEVLGVKEEEVLEQVREAGFARNFARRSDVEGHRDRGDRVGAIDVQNHVQAVGQLVLLVVDRESALSGRAGGERDCEERDGQGRNQQ